MAGRVGLLGAMLVSLAVATPAAAAPLKPCRDDRSARCGAIAVPVHRSDPDGPKLKVRFRILPRTDRSRPALEPIVAAEGGPGYSTIDSASGYEFMLRPLRARRDLIVMYGSKGHGLRGGRFTAGGAAYYSYGPVRLELKRVRYAADLAASGVAIWDRRRQRYSATLRLSGGRRGRLRVSWPSRAGATARITGRLGGRRVRLTTPAP